MTEDENDSKRIKTVHSKEARQPLSSIHVAIVGGGLGGLAMALALQNIGISCKVYEKDK